MVDVSLLQALQDTKEHIFIWQEPYHILDVTLQQYISMQLFQDHHKHIFLYTMKEHTRYLQYDWFQDSLYDALILWIGKGIADYLYMFKYQKITQTELKANQALIMEEDKCIKLQLWEVDVHG